MMLVGWRSQQIGLLLLQLTLICLLKDIHSTIVSRNNRGYIVIPTIDADWTIVYLKDNDITEIPASSVAPASALIKLDLSGNQIEFIHDDAFISCIALAILNLNENRLTALPSSFGPNVNNFKKLYVNNNILLDTSQSYFARFPNLDTLMAGNTEIDVVDGEGFGALEGLELHKINYMPDLNGHSHIKTLTLQGLNITTFPFTHLSNMTNLKFLEFSHSKLEVFPEVIGLPALTMIDLSGSDRMKVIADTSLLPSLTDIMCYDCPLSCGSDFCWFFIEDHDIYIDPPPCAESDVISPLSLRCYDGKYISSIRSSQC